jgi:hypothetical protein
VCPPCRLIRRPRRPRERGRVGAGGVLLQCASAALVGDVPAPRRFGGLDSGRCSREPGSAPAGGACEPGDGTCLLSSGRERALLSWASDVRALGGLASGQSDGRPHVRASSERSAGSAGQSIQLSRTGLRGASLRCPGHLPGASCRPPRANPEGNTILAWGGGYVKSFFRLFFACNPGELRQNNPGAPRPAYASPRWPLGHTRGGGRVSHAWSPVSTPF